MGLTVNSEIDVAGQFSDDGKQYKTVGNKHIPYDDAADYLALVPATRRHIGQIGYITGSGAIEVWQFVGGIADGNFVKVTSPAAAGSETISAAASEDLAAGDFVNLYSNAGTINARKADATDSTKAAHGFVLADVIAPATATVYMPSQNNNQVAGLTVGDEYYLSTTPGLITNIAPAGSGSIVQRVGIANSATSIVFVPDVTIELS